MEPTVLAQHMSLAMDSGSITVLRNMFLAAAESRKSGHRLGGLSGYAEGFEALDLPLLVIAGTKDDLAPPASVAPGFDRSRVARQDLPRLPARPHRPHRWARGDEDRLARARVVDRRARRRLGQEEMKGRCPFTPLGAVPPDPCIASPKGDANRAKAGGVTPSIEVAAVSRGPFSLPKATQQKVKGHCPLWGEGATPLRSDRFC